jgi:hypothetical protein
MLKKWRHSLLPVLIRFWKILTKGRHDIYHF